MEKYLYNISVVFSKYAHDCFFLRHVDMSSWAGSMSSLVCLLILVKMSKYSVI